MSRFEPFEVAAMKRPSRIPLSPHLPFHVEPQSDEALLSWLLRLAERSGLPITALTQSVFGTDARARRWQGWNRPDASLLATISTKTRVSIEQLRGMTYDAHQRIVCHDEVTQRLSSRKFIARASTQQLRSRVAVCLPCLKEDAHPYLRLTWTLGWVGLCPRHAAILVSRCPACRAQLGFPTLTSRAPFMPHRCRRCGIDLTSWSAQRAHERAAQMQRALLAGSCTGSVQFPGIGPLSWPIAMAAADVLLGMLWRNTLPRRRERLYARVIRDFDLEPQICWTQPHGGLAVLAWLLDHWPHNVRAAFVILQTPRLPALIEGAFVDNDLRTQLKEIFRSAAPRPATAPRWWRPWLEQLPLTSQQLRERANQEQHKHRRVRLFVLAQLRDGRSVQAVAAAANLRQVTIYNWLHCAAKHGLDAMLERHKGRQQLSSAQASQLAQWIAANRPHPKQPAFRILRTQDVIDEAARRFDIHVTVNVARRLIRLHRFRRGSRKRLHWVREASSVISAPVRDLRP